MSRIVIIVTHLLGVGHLTRAASLGRGLAKAGHAVTLVSGGRAAPLVRTDGLRLVQLPSVHCRGIDFRTLYDDAGAIVEKALLDARKARLVEILDEVLPDALITETYPFGRRQLAAEFGAALEYASAMSRRPAILASIRDILNPPSKLDKARETAGILGRFYDAVLVHGDEAVAPLTASWPETEGLRPRLRYTGYIAEDPTTENAHGGSAPPGAVLVSGGGSAASLPLYRAATGAAALDESGRPWRILVGHGVDPPSFEALVAAGGRAIVERARPDFPTLLAAAAVSVSQAGYNTVVDLARAGTRAVLVPFEQGREEEQRIRAERLAAEGAAVVLREDALSAQTLLAAIREALALPAPEARLRLDGIRGSIAAVEAAIDARAGIEVAWRRLDRAVAEAQTEGRQATLWWRDDDAVDDTAALRRLLALAERHHVPLALAVVPASVTSGLASALEDHETVTVLPHGYAHIDHAPEGRKKQELGFRPSATIVAELADGIETLRALFGGRLQPVLVPPWNRIDPALSPWLSSIGIAAVSTFGSAALPGVASINTHLDPIDWRGGRSLADEAGLVTALAAHVESGTREPLGLLTHHLVHDGWTWGFVERLLDFVSARSTFRWVDVETLLAMSRQSES